MLAILVLSILTVIGIALMLITSTESRIAANEWSINRGFYAADAGVRWGTVQLNNPQAFLTRQEFAAPTCSERCCSRCPPTASSRGSVS